MTSPDQPPPPEVPYEQVANRPAGFDDWLQAFKEQVSFFTGVRLAAGLPRWRLADVVPVLPVVGACIGVAVGLLFAIVRGLSGPGWLAGVLAVGAAVLITRALHEDGLADTADGLGPHGLDTARRLEIMRDSRNGTFGVLALALTVLLKVACLAKFGSSTGLVVLIAVHAVSRAAIAIPLLAFSPVRSDGLGVRAGKPSDNDVWLAVGIGVVVAFLLLLGKGILVALFAPLLAVAAAWVAALWIAERIGGYTGDTLGAVQQIAEIVFLVIAALLIAR